ncbi:MAG: PAS domain-containing protein, partial [Acetobacteraceae bacterium]|nr:PAS domain-containing protein [Acetobacteraceae bacterium]
MSESSLHFLAGGGEMGERMRNHAWHTTPLGTPDTWPTCLRALVGTCLNSAFPILLWWGPELVKLYNDPYANLLGEKHPHALGRAGREVWPELWDTIGPMLAHVTEHGEAVPAEDLLLLPHRRGYPEESYFSFSYSPIRDEHGRIGGVFCPIVETTERVISERRQRTLGVIAGVGRCDSAAEAAAACLDALAHAGGADLPFALLYLLDADRAEASLAGAAGIERGGEAAPERIALANGSTAPWPIAALPPTGRRMHGLAGRFADLPRLP